MPRSRLALFFVVFFNHRVYNCICDFALFVKQFFPVLNSNISSVYFFLDVSEIHTVSVPSLTFRPTDFFLFPLLRIVNLFLRLMVTCLSDFLLKS